ncbi:tyrosine-type recombinase/integrase, partial [Jeotgalibaca porci]|uniref:tyrosine-type recombinase/integrase n=1 Tax=Jeotgalibaca porci TaxID=1868793 RepID=UPI0035A19431
QSDPTKIDYLFLNPNGKLYERTSVTNPWSKLIKKMTKHREDLPALTPHSLRHSFITKKAQESNSMGDLIRLRDEVGHKKLDTTMDVYVQRAKGFIDRTKSDL